MTAEELRQLLTEPEGERIEFKPAVINRSEIAEYAVGIGNAGGGWLVMGVTDKRPRRLSGMAAPAAEELTRIRNSVADSAQIHLTFEVIQVPEGCVLVTHIPPRPRGTPFHTRTGKYLIRVDEGLRGMTLPELDAIRREAGVEFTAQIIPGDLGTLISPAGFEALREMMREVSSPPDMLRLSDGDLLRSLGLLTDDGLLMGGLLLVGREDSLRKFAPYAGWQFRHMLSDTDYDQPEDGVHCIAIILKRLRELIAPYNPIVTIKGWLMHPEFPRYPKLALRELLLNALVHRDFTTPGAVAVKLYPHRLEISNPGGFVGGVTTENILHHPSSPRYPTLFNALTRLRFANASNLGVPRVYRELLSEGKEPPLYWTTGHVVRVTVKGQDARREFLELVKDYPDLDVDHLLVLHYLMRHREVTVQAAAEICQRDPDSAREQLSQLVARWKLIETGGSGRGRYYRLSHAAYDQLGSTLNYHVDRRLARENVQARILAALADRPLTNAQIREITQMDRKQVTYLMRIMAVEQIVHREGRGRASRWVLRKP